MVPKRNSNTAAAKVGTNHLRSLGLSAGKKNARICQIIIGIQATSAAQIDTMKRKLKESSTPSTNVWGMPLASCGINSATGCKRN